MVGWMFLICICVEKWRWCLEIRDLQNPMDMFELKAQPHGFAYTYRAKYRHCDMHDNPRAVSPSLFVVLLQCCLKQQLHMHLFVAAFACALSIAKLSGLNSCSCGLDDKSWKLEVLNWRKKIIWKYYKIFKRVLAKVAFGFVSPDCMFPLI